MALAFSLTVIYIFLKKVSVRNPFIWTIFSVIVLQQSGWLYRFTMARPFTLAPIFLVLMLYFLYGKKYLALAIVSFLYFYWHTATFIFPFCLAFGYFLFEQFYGKKPDWKIVIWSFSGTLAAVVLAYIISPGIIAYLRDVIFPVFFNTTFAKTVQVAEGNEVYGKDFFSVVSSFFWVFAILIIAGSYEIMRYIKTKRGTQAPEDELDMSIQPMRMTLFMATIAFLAASTLSARFLDYFIYFGLLYSAIAVSDVAKFFKIDGTLFKKTFWFGVGLSSLYLLVSLSLGFYDQLGGSRSQITTQAPAEWLIANEKQDQIILNVDWDSFPTLYYYTGDKFRYTTGLEPRFLYDLDPKMYWIWNSIGSGYYCESSDCTDITNQREKEMAGDESRKKWYEDQGNLIADAVKNEFKTDIIVASVARKSLLVVMDNSDRFKKEFLDEKNSNYVIYRIIK
jgi:hypothetical protein